MLNSSESDEINKITELVDKNPISVIHEYCQLNNIKPTYVVDDEEGSPHCKLFTVTCTICDLKATGVGKSKKEAKLNAAVSAIEQLRTNGLMNLKDFEGKRQKSNKRLKLSENFFSSKIAENPVGFLQEYCIDHMLTLPSYTEETCEAGYSIICAVNSVSCQGVDQKKKKAKADAAKQMCEILIKEKNEIKNNEDSCKSHEEGESHTEDTRKIEES